MEVRNWSPSDATLTGTTVEQRAGLIHFGAWRAGMCCAVTSDRPLIVCGEPGPWYVVAEDARAGITNDGHFYPATTSALLCERHKDELLAEPRTVFEVDGPDLRRDRGHITVISLDALFPED